MTLPSLPGAPTLQRPAAVYPAIPEDTHSRYIEAALGGIVVGCLYLPNGNPAPGPKFDYKLRWFECLAKHGISAADAQLAM
jgi:exodeoxyribonuclease III